MTAPEHSVLNSSPRPMMLEERLLLEEVVRLMRQPGARTGTPCLAQQLEALLPYTEVIQECSVKCGYIILGCREQLPFQLACHDNARWDFGTTHDVDGMTLFLMVMIRDGKWDWIDLSRGDGGPLQRFPKPEDFGP